MIDSSKILGMFVFGVGFGLWGLWRQRRKRSQGPGPTEVAPQAAPSRIKKHAWFGWKLFWLSWGLVTGIVFLVKLSESPGGRWISDEYAMSTVPALFINLRHPDRVANMAAWAAGAGFTSAILILGLYSIVRAGRAWFKKRRRTMTVKDKKVKFYLTVFLVLWAVSAVISFVKQTTDQDVFMSAFWEYGNWTVYVGKAIGAAFVWAGVCTALVWLASYVYLGFRSFWEAARGRDKP